MDELRLPAGSRGDIQFAIPRKPLQTESNPEKDVRLSYHSLTNNAPSPARHKPSSRVILPRALKKVWHYLWSLEILSFFLSLIALAAIAITLSIHHNRPMPQWPKLISINSLIAILTAVLKAAMLMPVAEGISQLKWHWFRQSRPLIDLERIDSASRGPWGSFLLLLTTCKHYLAIFGAVIVVIALAIDHFSQQVVHYYDCLQPVQGSVARISKTNNNTRTGPHTSAKDVALDGPMAAALYTGLIDPPANASSSIQIQCPTGNCTFPENDGVTHVLLAMCSDCTDFSEAIEAQHHPAIGYSEPNDITWLSIQAYWPNLNSSYVSAFDALMYRSQSCTNEAASSCPYELFAVHCELYPCLKTYLAKVTNFVLDEKIISSIRLQETPTEGLDYTLLARLALRDGVWHMCNGTDKSNQNNSVTVPGQAPGKYYPDDCVWNFGWEPTWALRTYFAMNLFIGTVNSSELHTPAGAIGSPWLINLFAGGNATLGTSTEFMNGLSNAMTAIIRQNGDTPESAYAYGTVYGLQTCIRVQWVWLSLPAALVLLTAIFLTATIVTTKSWRSPWKSSALALLFHGLDTGIRERYGPMTKIQSMEDEAKAATAELARPESGWKFTIS